MKTVEKEFKTELFRRVLDEVDFLDGNAQFEFFEDNSDYFQSATSPFDDTEYYEFKNIDGYELHDLIYLGEEILKRQGKTYTIIEYIDDKLIFEGYISQLRSKYLERKEELGLI